MRRTGGLQAGVEEGDRVRAPVCDVFSQLDKRRWQHFASKFMKQVLFSDCRPVVGLLLHPSAAKPADKRLSIELASMRQSLYQTPGETEGDPFLQDERPKETTDIPRWIDAEVMIAHPFTKIMHPVQLVQAVETNKWNVEQPISSVIVKKVKQLRRGKAIAELLRTCPKTIEGYVASPVHILWIRCL